MNRAVTNIAIPAMMEIGENVIDTLGERLRQHGFQSVTIMWDGFVEASYGSRLLAALDGCSAEPVLLDRTFSIQEITGRAFQLPASDVLIGMGGGAVIDMAKYTAFLRKIPVISIPTSASNDGFASSGCSLIVNGRKTSVPAKIPFGIVAELTILQKAPDPFILAGIGDLMSNITALYDWQFEEKQGAGTVNAFAEMLSKKAVNSFIRTPMADIHAPVLLKELISSMTMSGIATEISGSSAPISGSEHLISHALDQWADHPQMHGIQVGVAAYIMALVHEHRFERMRKVFERTGFFDYVRTLGMKQADFLMAIDRAPKVKPNRHTYLHEEAYRLKAKQAVQSDPVLKTILH
ncbi:iron-containing alcohol dehydrogenase family protein [Domibacillus indicus]|uniref:iron-containing alcohol dehydrogenase family protein n=1 Tax=Domibacillus indicus TaxID=1437523 RepID=UPI000617D006|nr:iron-containing alcohol dehydrogenase family protein [Domibacillus indicus]